MHVRSLVDGGSPDADASTSNLSIAVHRYIDSPRPWFTRLPIDYRMVPLQARMAGLTMLRHMRPPQESTFPAWPIETAIDDELEASDMSLTYGGRRAALVITHDIDSAAELEDIERLRAVERDLGLPSAFGFVPRQSWPTEELARSLVAEGCEVYWHDIGHDGRLPYIGVSRIRDAFERVADRWPWSHELCTTFRAGQLLVSRDLMQVVSERFAIDMSIPDSERSGPYGGAAGCGTVLPFYIDGLLELPLTMPQEVYLRHVYGLTAEEALAIWLAKLDHIRARGGVAVLNIHPVWIGRSHGDMMRSFTFFLKTVARLDDVLVATPSSVAAQIDLRR